MTQIRHMGHILRILASETQSCRPLGVLGMMEEDYDKRKTLGLPGKSCVGSPGHRSKSQPSQVLGEIRTGFL